MAGAETAVSFEALQAQANAITELFGRTGYELVAPAMLQPADLFLDRMGEAIRSRTYVFTDLDGEELCLRPDLTLPVCRLYLERHPDAGREARYCYNGPAFRYQPKSGNGAPREFRQAGIEYFGGTDRAAAEAEVLALAVEAVRSAGVRDYRIVTGDLGLFEALIQALDIPERWRSRLRHFFWRPPVFHDLLRRLTRPPGTGRGSPVAGLIDRLDPEDREAAEEQVGAHLESEGIPLEGARSLSEITERLLDRAADTREAPLGEPAAALIEAYLKVSGPPDEALQRIAGLAGDAGLDLGAALQAAHARRDAFAGRGIDLARMTFSAEFGRDLQYYSGLVFQIEVPGMGRTGQVAGGGRYDTLLGALGAPRDVPAVGSAIHTERLLAAARGRAA